MDIYARNFLKELTKAKKTNLLFEETNSLNMGMDDINLDDEDFGDDDPDEMLNRKSTELQGMQQNKILNANQNDAAVLKKMVNKIDLVSSVIGNVENDPSSLGSFLASTVSQLSDAKLKRDLFNLITQQQRGIADAIEGLARIKARIQGIGAVSIGQKIADPFDSINGDKKK
jgi:hypothetical protein